MEIRRQSHVIGTTTDGREIHLRYGQIPHGYRFAMIQILNAPKNSDDDAWLGDVMTCLIPDPHVTGWLA